MTPLASAGQLGAYLGVSMPDERAAALLGQASDLLRGATHQRFDFTEHDVVVLDPVDDVVFLPELPVHDVSALRVLVDDTGPGAGAGSGTAGPSWSTFPDRWVWSATGVVRAVRSWSWPRGPRSVEVTYTHGYEPDDVPRDLAAGCVALAAELYANPTRVASWQTGGVSMRFDSAALPSTVQAVIDRYSVVGVA